LSVGTCCYYYQLRKMEARYWNFYNYYEKQQKYCIFFMFSDHNTKERVKK
jgi:hypothetical protein